MNHRYLVRLPLRLPVEVFKQEQFLGRYITRNMDVEGVFIEIRTTDLEANDVVKLVFILPDGGSRQHTLMAGVDGEGAGMMLFDYEHKAPNILRAVDRSSWASDRLAQVAL